MQSDSQSMYSVRSCPEITTNKQTTTSSAAKQIAKPNTPFSQAFATSIP